jgi:hypothetical protein
VSRGQLREEMARAASAPEARLQEQRDAILRRFARLYEG